MTSSEAVGVLAGGDERAVLESLHITMATIRAFEVAASAHYRDGAVPGFVHISIGQEAVAAGACWPLRKDDRIASNHRGHGHCIAKGMDVRSMFAELLGRSTGTCGGRGGSMHIADPALGVLGANGIVGAGIPIAVGGAFAGRQRGEDTVAVAFFGDGAVATGAFHEATNLAALWGLPLILLCENNQYAEFSAAADQQPVPISARGAAYGIESFEVDGNDALAVARLMSTLVDRCRGGEGPFLVEAATYRWHGHYEGDPERYRAAEEVEARRADDPLARNRSRLVALGVDESHVDGLERAAQAEVEAAIALATADPRPAPEDLAGNVVAPRVDAIETPPAVLATGAEGYRVMDALHDALEVAMEHDQSVFVAGIDVAEGNVFGITRGLEERFPGRLRNTPISETAIVGLGVGAAMSGLRPVVEIMYADFVGVCFDQVMNQAAKLRYMTGGAASLPLTIRTQFGAGRSSGSQHSQSIEALLAHIPGLTVVMPSTAEDAYGLLRASILDPNPVVFLENRLLYGKKGRRPPADHLVPLGRAAIRRRGTDVTVVAVSKMVDESLAAAEEVAAEGIDVEVIDLRTVVPLDRACVLESLGRTGRLLIAHQATRDFGIGAELAALAVDEGFWSLDAPVRRVATPAVPAPYSPPLEAAWLVGREEIAAELRSLARV